MIPGDVWVFDLRDLEEAKSSAATWEAHAGRGGGLTWPPPASAILQSQQWRMQRSVHESWRGACGPISVGTRRDGRNERRPVWLHAHGLDERSGSFARARDSKHYRRVSLSPRRGRGVRARGRARVRWVVGALGARACPRRRLGRPALPFGWPRDRRCIIGGALGRKPHCVAAGSFSRDRSLSRRLGVGADGRASRRATPRTVLSGTSAHRVVRLFHQGCRRLADQAPKQPHRVRSDRRAARSNTRSSSVGTPRTVTMCVLLADPFTDGVVGGVKALGSTQPDDAWDGREHGPGVITTGCASVPG